MLHSHLHPGQPSRLFHFKFPYQNSVDISYLHNTCGLYGTTYKTNISKSQYNHKKAAINDSILIGITASNLAEIVYFRNLLNLISGLRIVLWFEPFSEFVISEYIYSLSIAMFKCGSAAQVICGNRFYGLELSKSVFVSANILHPTRWRRIGWLVLHKKEYWFHKVTVGSG
jgi:hypothetical protein